MSSTTMVSRAPQLADGLAGAVDAREILEQELEPGRCRGRVGDDGVDAAVAEQVGQARLAAEPVAVGVDVRGQAHPLSRH